MHTRPKFFQHLKRRFVIFEAMILAVILTLTATVNLNAQSGTCGGQTFPQIFSDVPGTDAYFCYIAEIYFLGVTSGCGGGQYCPGTAVTRNAMAVFLDRVHDSALKRGSRRAALDQFWTLNTGNLKQTTVGNRPQLLKSDGTDVWVANYADGTVSRVRTSDGSVSQTWTGATNATGVLVALGYIFVTGQSNPNGSLYQIDPSAASGGAVTVVTSSLGANPQGIAFDGTRIWTANTGGSVSFVTLNPTSVTTVSTGFSQPAGMIFDGSNIWVTDKGDNTIKKLDSSGNILQSVSVGTTPQFPAFDGTNIWVPNATSASVSIIRPSDGVPLETLTGNGLNNPRMAAFDGQRILVTNANDTVSLFKAADLTNISNPPTISGTTPFAVCSDGVNFWLTGTAASANKVTRF